MSILVPDGSALVALSKVRSWWAPFCDYNEIQALPASGAFWVPAAPAQIEPLTEQKTEFVFIFEDSQHAHEFLEAFHEVHRDDPKLQATWPHYKVIPLSPQQVVGALIGHGLTPIQVRRDWAPEMFRLYRDGHHGASGSRHGPAVQFAVDHALEDAARIERERRV